MSIGKSNRKFTINGLLLLIAVFALSFSLNFGTAHAATYTVNSTNDVNNGTCDGTHCSLREAILAANSNSGADTIAFSVSGTITLGNNLAKLTDSAGVTISGGGNITLDGADTINYGIRMDSASASNVVKGLTFKRFVLNAVLMEGSNSTLGGTAAGENNVLIDGTAGTSALLLVNGSGMTIINNYIGVESDGSTANGSYNGISLTASASSVTIGGDASNERNVISGNSNCGIAFAEAPSGTVTITGNYIGTTSTGGATAANGNGVCTNSSGLTYGAAITIGTTTSGESNLISGNTNWGVNMIGTFNGNLDISGNIIGLNKDSNGALPNGQAGIIINGATCNATCRIASNTIAGNTSHGVTIRASSSNFTLINNKIGNDGTTAYPNNIGVVIEDSPSIIVGSTDGTYDTPNIISGNTSHGISISGSSTSSITIAENVIGLKSDLSAALLNGGDGVYLSSAGTTTFGVSSSSSTLNIIGGNTGDGIEIASNEGAIGVYSSSIGVYNATDFGNGGDGIKVSGTPAAAVTIGNGSTGKNIVSGNTGNGISVNSGSGHVIKGNHIGTNKDADGAVANATGGIAIYGGTGTTIGGSSSGDENIIGGNGDYGILVQGGSGTATITRNYIGTNSSSIDLGNDGAGVLINGGATSNTLGYGFGETLTGLAKANYMGFNGNGADNDVTVDGATTATNSLRGNVFTLAATDSSANMVFNTGTQGGASNSGVSTRILDDSLRLTLAGLADGTKVDWYTLNGSFATTYQGTATTTSGTATLSGAFTVGDKAFYQITLANGTSYPIAQAGNIISNAPTGLASFAITNLNGSLRATWTAASSTIFDHYEIWYGQTQSDVENRTGTATEWDNDNDSGLATVTTVATTIVDSGVNLNIAGQNYYAKIWAYSTSGGNATLTTATYNTGASGGSGSGGGATVQKKEEFFKDSVKKNDEKSEKDKEAQAESVREEAREEVDLTDSDGDGLADAKEKELGTNPASEDSDQDGLKDGKEVIYYKTNPLKVDTDGDGYADGYEILNLKTDPLDDCEPGNANANKEKLAECAKKLDEEKLKTDEKKEETVTVEEDNKKLLKINEEEMIKFDEAIKKKLRDDYEWAEKHFIKLSEMESMKKAYSNSVQIKKIMDSFVEEPALFIRNGEAIAIAMAVFNEDIFEEASIRSAETNTPFIEKGFAKGVINSYVNKDFNPKEYITRANTFRLMFRVSGLKLRKEFGKSLYENFAVKSPVFPDVSERHPAFGYILYLQNKGLLQSYAGGNFAASDYMERAEFVKMMTLFQQEATKQESVAVQ